LLSYYIEQYNQGYNNQNILNYTAQENNINHYCCKSTEHITKYFVRQAYFRLRRVLSLSETMNGVIWSKMQKTFVPISSVPVFAMMQQERLKQSRALETHNFQLQNLTLTAFQVRFCETQIAKFLDIHKIKNIEISSTISLHFSH